MRFLRELFRYFGKITTGILIICAVSCSLSGGEDIPADTLWKILLSGAVTAMITGIMMILPEPNSKKRYFLYTVLHYILLCIPMSVMGIWFGWASANIYGVMFMCLSVALVYAFTAAVTCFTSKRDAENLTRLLRTKYGKK